MAEVVLVHGLWFGRWSTAVLARRLRRAGFRVRLFGYPTRGSVAINTAALAEFCRASTHPQQHLLGHSLGGLLILHVLRREAMLPPGRVLLIGTPLAGSEVARRGLGLPGGRYLLGSAIDLLDGRAPDLPVDRETGMIAGTRSLGLGRLVGGLSVPNDGTVAVRETLRPGLADRIEIAASHTGLLYSAAVARQAGDFLQFGRFGGLGQPPRAGVGADVP
ncbi:MAG: alpha/beta fold hydrolase [Xanthomonadales bacterium]|nr:alpha/beta fold hydrolase [Xanthomonadales bacterium]NIN59538.1 alpha/beta fold hydrolase [Xanthomonadales bacterium]NIN74904.1 alpha/beta fold hydrolase [Xanthomonadales bacterium]NIO14046.1 alpha/beta fold hydrolase [Xanthomonadales bacterium]NIP11931.1 alpha/beta fold hydrolase [Xanthomonadales bacterium]